MIVSTFTMLNVHIFLGSKLQDFFAVNSSLCSTCSRRQTIPWHSIDSLPNGPRQYILDDIDTYATTYGLHLKDTPLNLTHQLRRQHCAVLLTCSAPGANESTIQLRKCVGCSIQEGEWYTAVSPDGVSYHLVDHFTEEVTASYNTPAPWKTFDIMVPVCKLNDRLLAFTKSLSDAVRIVANSPFVRGISFRMIVSRFPGDERLFDDIFIANLKQVAKSSTLQIIFADCNKSEFHRAEASNCLVERACHDQDCLLTLMDVDVEISAQYIYNALANTYPGTSAYFPMSYHQYNPASVSKVEDLLKNDADQFELHHSFWAKVDYKGTWLPNGLGMVRIE